MYKVIIKINILNGLNLETTLNNIPIKHKSNNSVVIMKNCDPYLEYYNVTYEELCLLLEYINKLQTKDINIEIRLKN